MGDVKKLFIGANLAHGFEGTEKKIAEMYGLHDLGLLKGVPGGGKNTFMKKVIEHPLLESEQRIDYMCAGKPSERDGIVYPELGIGYLDVTPPHMTVGGRGIDLYSAVIQDKVNLDKLKCLRCVSRRRLNHFHEAQKHIADAVKSRGAPKEPDMFQVAYWVEKLDKFFSKRGIQPDKKRVVAFKRSITSQGIVDFADTWETGARTIKLPCSEEVASLVFRFLHDKYGGHAFLHFLQSSKMLEGVHVGNRLIRQERAFERPIDGEAVQKAAVELGGAETIMREELERIYDGAIDFDMVNKLADDDLGRWT